MKIFLVMILYRLTSLLSLQPYKTQMGNIQETSMQL